MKLAKMNESRLTLTFEEFEDKWRHRLFNEMDHEMWKPFCLALSDYRVPMLVRLRVLQHLAAERLCLDPSMVLAYYNETLITMGHPSKVIGTRLPKRDSW